ncbi:MAG: isopentenyl phosphate kinase family protein [Chloroflexi bacterium]|nr:isopentenyl phosphate kinase family protein [Chloroflexota bacterium]
MNRSQTSAPHFIKLGGSLITDKNRPVTPRPLVIQRLAEEIATAYHAFPSRPFLLSHGSGSYGHVVGRRYHTRQGVHDSEGWRGFAETGYIAAQLNRLVLAAFLRTGLPVISLPPSVLVRCNKGQIETFHIEPVQAALRAGLIPVLFGDIAFDTHLGGTIVSTEQVLAAATPFLCPGHITLVGVVDGVYDADPLSVPDATPLPQLRASQLDTVKAMLGGSYGVDVTGGMAGKIESMAELLRHHPNLRIHLLSGEIPGHLQEHLSDPNQLLGTTMTL